MFEFPNDFKWLLPWVRLPIDYVAFLPIPRFGEMTRCVGSDSIVEELRREMPDTHVLYDLDLNAVAVHVDGGHQDFVFGTNDPRHPIACVHLTYAVEADPRWPATSRYYDLSAWKGEMERDYSNAGRPNLHCDDKHYQIISRYIDGIDVHFCARCDTEVCRTPVKKIV